MAQLKCSSCGNPVEQADVTCSYCGSLLGVPGAVSRVEEALTEVLTGGNPATPPMCSTPGCEQPATRGRTVCRMCLVRGAQTRTYVLLTPWGQRETLAEGVSVPVGRSPEFSPFAEHLASMESVSRIHAFFECRGGRLTVRDLGTTNGTRVNGARIAAQQEVTLVPGDVITLGGQVEFIVG